jgi:hypothetical protein
MLAAMGRRGALVAALGLGAALATAAGAADAPGVRTGVHDGAAFAIAVPARWGGGLVLFAHGYEGEGPGPGTLIASPLADHLAAGGYAVAASGYRAKGYRPDWFLADMLALRARFIRDVGPPRWTIIHGQSMGGHVAIASLELHPEVYQGALIECGVVEGVRFGDWLYAYTAAAQYFSKLPLLETPPPEFDRLADVVWPRVMGTPGNYTAAGRRFDSVITHLAGGDLPLRLTGMALNYTGNLYPRTPLPERVHELMRHADTSAIRYDIDPGLGIDAATLNREVPRVTPEPGARSRDETPVFAELTGRIRVPVLTIHETGDFRVPFRFEQDYRRRAERAGTAHLLVQRAVRGTRHCRIDDAVRARGFDDLVAWIERGIVPDGDDVLGDVTRLGAR